MTSSRQIGGFVCGVLVVLASAAIWIFLKYVEPNHSRQRPPGVPLDAVFGGGQDATEMLVCVPSGQQNYFNCTVYNLFSGAVSAVGGFVGSAPLGPNEWKKFGYMTEGKIVLIGAGGDLLMHGLISFPDIGIQQQYILGSPIGPKISPKR